VKHESDPFGEQIMQVVRQEYELLDVGGVIGISPALVAANAQESLDPQGECPALLGWAATLELRQMARSVCRKASCLEDPSEGGQGTLFDGQLQRRYPTKRNSEEQYVLREKLTLAERRDNSARLRAEASAKLSHADALDAETDALIRARVLVNQKEAA
jgi:hypothetical protein